MATLNEADLQEFWQKTKKEALMAEGALKMLEHLIKHLQEQSPQAEQDDGVNNQS